VSVLAPPAPPRPDDPELLIREARERQRRRRIRIAIGAALAVLTGAAIGFGVSRGGVSGASTPGPRPVVDAQAFAGHGRLAFVSRGRLWVLDGQTGKLTRVAGPGADDPVFSPDGRRLLYGFGKRFGLARADGTAPRLHAGGATWLPDGRLLLSGRRIDRVAADGTLVPAGRAPAGLSAWAPDGGRFVFDTTRIVHDKGGAFHGVELLQVADSLTGPRTTWYRLPQRFTPRSGYRTPGIDWIVVLPKRRGILLWLDPMHSSSIAADGLPVYELTAPGARPARLGTTVGGPGVSLSRSGRFALAGGVDRIAWVTKTALSCRTGRCTAVAPPAGKLTLDPALSPDGRTLAFVSAASEGTTMGLVEPVLKRWYATRRLWVGARVVPDSTGAAAPAWSGDGRSLLFAKDDALWLLPRLDAKPVRVVGPLFRPHGVWPNSMGRVPWPSQFAWWSGR